MLVDVVKLFYLLLVDIELKGKAKKCVVLGGGVLLIGGLFGLWSCELLLTLVDNNILRLL